jgi:hypothetical protein
MFVALSIGPFAAGVVAQAFVQVMSSPILFCPLFDHVIFFFRE